MRTTLKQTLAGAWMLLAALALSTAGCSQLEDAPDTGNRPGIATGNEPISISIAPKPGFEAGDAETRSGDAETRSTVGSGGVFAWEDGDIIYVVLTFDDHDTNPTVLYHKWIRGGTNTSIVAGWTVRANWTTIANLTTLNWPVGASKCTVQAFHTNCSATLASNGSGLTDLKYNNGQGDHMFFTDEFTVGTPLAIAFKHSTTRVTFTGLKASTKYRLQVNGVEPTFATSFKKEGFALADEKIQTFTTAASGTTGDTSFTICLPLTPAAVANTTIGIAAGEVKLTLLKVNADGTTTTPVNEAILKATGTSPNWVMNGNRYAVTVNEYAGGIDPDKDGNLLPTPPAVVPNGDVYEVNGYYISAAAGPWQWAGATTKDPCKAAGHGWRIPTMKDFEAMAGWGATNKWDVNNPTFANTNLGAGTNTAAFHNAFPVSNSFYWSSESRDTDTAWALTVKSSGSPTYNYGTKTTEHLVRCVQRKP